METDTTTVKAAETRRAPRVPPRWVVRTIWLLHRALYSISRRRLGLRGATKDRWGMLRLTTVGRRTGKERRSILGYLQDGPNLVTLAMNGWADPEPAWWLNLEAQPEARIETVDGSWPVRGRAAVGEERERLWGMFGGGLWGDLDAFAAKRSRETAVVVLEPHD